MSGPAPRFITPEGFARIRAEYEELFGTERPKLVETISWAAANGDRSENGDYIYGRKRLREVDRRISHLSRIMKAAKVVDPAYNVMLGSAYFQRMLNTWDGNVPLAVASYNAGAGNVRKWVNRYGDPRAPGADVVAWIEDIPFSETRGSVQRVLENTVVYDRMNPRATAPRQLSHFLGKARLG